MFELFIVFIIVRFYAALCTWLWNYLLGRIWNEATVTYILKYLQDIPAETEYSPYLW